MSWWTVEFGAVSLTVVVALIALESVPVDWGPVDWGPVDWGPVWAWTVRVKGAWVPRVPMAMAMAMAMWKELFPE